MLKSNHPSFSSSFLKVSDLAIYNLLGGRVLVCGWAGLALLAKLVSVHLRILSVAYPHTRGVGTHTNTRVL